MLGGIVNSDLVLAVLTDYNPNVWYELGTRHSLRHGTIMMLERGQKIPIDIALNRSSSPSNHEILSSHIDDCLPSHTAEYCAGFKFGLLLEEYALNPSYSEQNGHEGTGG
jgi:hypothetical protein